MTKRRSEISIINVFMCLVVVFIHVMSEPLGQVQSGTKTYDAYHAISRLTAFAVQGFIFLSGMKLFLNGRREKFGIFMLKRVKTIVIPYIVAVFVYFAYLVEVMKYFPFEWSRFGLYLIRGNIVSPFYFVIIIMQFYLLYPLWRLILNKVKARIAIPAAAAVTVVCGLYGIFVLDGLGIKFKYLDRVFLVYLLYWVCGMYAGQHYEAFIKFMRKHATAILITAFSAAVVDSVTFLLYSHGLIKPTHLNTVHAVYVCAIIAACFAAFSDMSRRLPKLLRVLDYSSYYIFLAHVLFIYILRHDVPLPAASSVTAGFVRDAAIIYAAIIVFAEIVYCIRKRWHQNVNYTP